MDILNEFALSYNHNFLTTTMAPTNYGKSAVFEKIMIDYIKKGFDCLYIGELSEKAFYRRMQRKVKQYKYEHKENHGKIIYKANYAVLNELYFEKLICIHRPKVVFLDYVFERHNSLYKLYNMPKSLLLEKTIKIEEQSTRDLNRVQMEKVFYMDLRHLMNDYKISFYVSKSLNRNPLPPINDRQFNILAGNSNLFSMMESDVVFAVNRNNPINAELTIVKNRFGSENKKVEILL